MTTIWKNDSVELDYQEKKVKFGNEEFTAFRHLYIITYNKPDEKITSLVYDLDDTDKLYSNGLGLSIFQVIDELLPYDFRLVDFLTMCDAIAKFKTKLHPDMSNKEFSEELRDTSIYNFEDEENELDSWVWMN